MTSSAFAARLKRELDLLEHEPPPGVSVWPHGDRMDVLRGCIRGADGTPYRDGIFHLEVTVPQRYPFDPPRVRFLTPIHHPNIDSSGRICLNILNMPPKGAWKPALNISTVLASILVLLAEPNPDDALMVEISQEFIRSRESFNQRARKLTLQHAQKETYPEDDEGNNSRGCSSEEQGSASGVNGDASDQDIDDTDLGFSRKRQRRR
mmetsp:Transcript_10945/g.33564  ORF Transcript_10945/g.33564 Transcript_10945/m.33564 type:complete len:207 (+) Transcript_10945:113-733(+)